MKKIIASAVGLMMAGGIASTASAAVENQFGGYWRTRFMYEDNMSGTDTPSLDSVDTRTRLFYTAKFSDDFKFVNKFEFNTGWGDKNGGDIGADGKGNWRIKNSYADFNMGQTFNAKVGIQSATIARGFIFSDDFSGIMLTGKFGNVTVPLVWINAMNKDTNSWDGSAIPDFDDNIFAALVSLKINDGMTITPYFVYNPIRNSDTIEDSDNWYAGVDADLKFGAVSVWGTGIYNGGTLGNLDTSAYLFAAGANAGIVHGQAFYASGDDNAHDGDNNGFVSVPGLSSNANNTLTMSPFVGSSYYWAEIMGYGAFDNHVSHGSPADDITNIWAANAGVTLKPVDKVKVDFDVWYAALAQEDVNGNTELGTEFDGKLTYSIYDNLTAEFILAYLISGDATGPEDVTEGGLQLSLSF